MKLLLIEDDARLAENCKLYLENSQFVVDVCKTGSMGLLKAKDQPYSVIILDWMLPDISGIDVLRELRKRGVTTPVIMTTARSQVEDKLEGFSLGIDDYVTKPYALSELLARITAVQRRTSTGTTDKVTNCSYLSINFDTCAVTCNGKKVELTPKEYAILELLTLNKESVVLRSEIIHHVWSEDVDLFSNHVEVHMKNLRQKIDIAGKNSLIVTVKGKGYMLTENADETLD
jgi:DNA-binding response OmpR family regulator